MRRPLTVPSADCRSYYRRSSDLGLFGHGRRAARCRNLLSLGGLALLAAAGEPAQAEDTDRREHESALHWVTPKKD